MLGTEYNSIVPVLVGGGLGFAYLLAAAVVLTTVKQIFLAMRMYVDQNKGSYMIPPRVENTSLLGQDRMGIWMVVAPGAYDYEHGAFWRCCCYARRLR